MFDLMYFLIYFSLAQVRLLYKAEKRCENSSNVFFSVTPYFENDNVGNFR